MRVLFIFFMSACAEPKDLGGISVNERDADGDGFSQFEDCDDTNSFVYPEAPEQCDGIDSNCNGVIDDNAIDANSWYLDQDEDGFGDAQTELRQCEQPIGYTDVSGDCNDDNTSINPNQPELCDGIDNNCNTEVDDDDPLVQIENQQQYFQDGDGDGYGAPPSSYYACAPTNSNSVTVGGDCNDQDDSIFPAAVEVCDGIDNDCDTLIDADDDDGEVRWYADQDNDSFGAANNFQSSCEQPSGFVSNALDCDDSNEQINPSSTEVCDEIDNDCDDLIDDADQDVDAATGFQHYYDGDGDGFGTSNSLEYSCSIPSGRVLFPDDCNDTEASISPDAVEQCQDTLDNNCDQLVDCDDSSCLFSTNCFESDCTDGVDNDLDGPWDCLDNDCLNSGDCGESQCSDGQDNDNDGFTDCLDSQCFLNSNCASNSCPNFDLLSAMGPNILFGDTLNATNYADPACGSYYGTGVDYSARWTAPVNGCATFDTLNSSFDTVIAVYNDCADMSDPTGYLTGGCNDQANNTDQSRLFCNVVQGEDYIILIDGWESTDAGQYGLNVSLQVGASCNCSSTCCTN